MQRIRAGLALVASVALLGAPAGGAGEQVTDHLKCYKIKDAVKLTGVVDLSSPQFGLEAGCKIGRTALFCVPVSKTVQSVSDRVTGAAITPLALSAPPQPGDQVCYKVKCPRPPVAIADQSVTDQFGNRTVGRFKAKLVCSPAVKGTAFCGDGTIDPSEDCEPGDLGGTTCASLGFASGTLACAPGCTYDTSGCVGHSPSTCGNGTIDGAESCDGAELGGATCASLGYTRDGTLGCTAGCGYDLSGCRAQAFPATGQMTCWNTAGQVVACAGTGHDGEVQAGAALAYVDNGDGTIIDLNTGLMWAKKSDDGAVHDKDLTHSWDNAFAVYVATLNASGFAGHSDWRMPNVKELESIVNFEQSLPSVSAPFDTGCMLGCSVLTCSCTASSPHWTSSSQAGSPTQAWEVTFVDGGANVSTKLTSNRSVRAVRGGS
jgi:hypothetical protein